MSQIEELVLKKIKFGICQSVSESFLQDIKFETYHNVLSDQLMSQLTYWVLGRETHKQVVDSVTYPASWKEALKERFYPDFLKKRFPVKFIHRNVEVHHFHVCPHINVKFENDEIAHFDFLKGEGGVAEK